MRGIKVVSGIVNNIAIFEDGTELPGDWINAPGGVAIGDIENGDGTFSRPPQPEPEPPTIAEQIGELERSVTQRNLRGAALGDSFAIAKIQSIENQIAVLRSEL